MKKSSCNYLVQTGFIVVLVLFFLAGCKKKDNLVKFAKGEFPDTVINITDINSVYDDYNTSLYQITGGSSIVFSSNRKSTGGQFDLEQGTFSFVFDQTDGSFGMGASMSSDPFITKLINQANTPGNDFGPYRLFSPIDGFEYMILSSETSPGDLDLYYMKNQPAFGTNLPAIDGPHPIKLLNGTSNDAYLCLNFKMDTAYFTSDRTGDFDIYLHSRPKDMDLATWFSQDFAASVKVDSVNSPYNDKCPMVYSNIMVFTSDRPGGLGGYDLYYSVFRNGKWSEAVNLGPRINSSSDEYRPVVGATDGFTNNFLIFSSNRPGGKGGFDLYFTGWELPTR